MSPDIGMGWTCNCTFGLFFVGLVGVSGLTVLAWIDDQDAWHLAAGGVHDGDVEVLDKQEAGLLASEHVGSDDKVYNS